MEYMTQPRYLMRSEMKVLVTGMVKEVPFVVRITKVLGI